MYRTLAPAFRDRDRPPLAPSGRWLATTSGLDETPPDHARRSLTLFSRGVSSPRKGSLGRPAVALDISGPSTAPSALPPGESPSRGADGRPAPAYARRPAAERLKGRRPAGGPAASASVRAAPVEPGPSSRSASGGRGHHFVMSRSARSADPRRGPARARADNARYRPGHARDGHGPRRSGATPAARPQGRARRVPARLARWGADRRTRTAPSAAWAGRRLNPPAPRHLEPASGPCTARLRAPMRGRRPGGRGDVPRLASRSRPALFLSVRLNIDG